MYLRKLALLVLFVVTQLMSASAQIKNINFQISTISSSTGHWKGTLTYLDYSSANSYTMPAEIDISYTSNKAGYIRAYTYPNEPKANSTDTTYTKESGRYFGREKVISFVKTNSRDFTLITEFDDVDGNDKKEATIRHKYKLEGNSFIIRMDVKFKGTTNWLNRHEYQFTNEKKVVSSDLALYHKIKDLDSLMFNAYNQQDLSKMKSYFTSDLEWYQDNGGLLNFETVFTNFQTIFDKKDKLTRELVYGTLEVIPIKGFGAIEIGKHKFKHMENGKLEIGTFRFLMIWKNVNGDWKISRVVSFDH
ncbi:MAG: nuclear transport factor 2 family protein [Bacteroidetes bacterium]|nr:nuclear transport factor 2 family protein [Bacteroidota bacterium]